MSLYQSPRYHHRMRASALWTEEDPAEVRPDSWKSRALCSQTDPEQFYPEKGASVRAAKDVCARCEVRADCLEYAIEKGDRFGVWGGMTYGERKGLVRTRAVVYAQAEADYEATADGLADAAELADLRDLLDEETA
jgi:WhiB family redox-sensing transcriptional regulator